MGASNDTSGFAHAFANLLKTMVGSGLLTLPYVTAQAGLVLSVVGLYVIAVLTQAAIRLLVRCVVHERMLSGATYVDLDQGASAMHGSSSWHLVSTAAFGRMGWYVTVTALMSAQLGVVSSYLDFVGSALVTYAGMSALASRLLLWCLVSALCMLRVLKSVAVLSMVSLLVYAYILVLIVYFGAQHLPVRVAAEPHLVLFAPSRFGTWFGPSLFAFEGMGTALSIFESMKTADAKPFFSVISAAYVVGVVVYSGVASWGYAAWGSGVGSARHAHIGRRAPRLSHVQPLLSHRHVPLHTDRARARVQVVLASFPETLLGTSGQLMLSVVLFLSYPIQVTPVFQVVEAGVAKACPPLAPLWPLGRALVVALTCSASYLIPDMEAMVGLTGALSFSVIGFVLPGLFFLKLRPPQPTAAELVLAYAMVALGIGGGSWAVYSELSRL